MAGAGGVRPAALLRLVGLEARLRLRRGGTLAALLAMVALSWLVIPDPAGGRALMVVGRARVLYTSATLALGSAAMAAMLLGLGGFYLVRGRVGADLRSGAGAVIAATRVGNAALLLSRWVGAVLYLGALVLVFMLSIVAMHALYGDGPVEIGLYLRVYAVLLLPMLLFGSACALLFDSLAWLMGKVGDTLFFCVWVGQLALLVDFTGLGNVVLVVNALLHAPHALALGNSAFDAALAPLTLGTFSWPGPVLAVRAGAALLALTPLLPAVLLFHRFSPDRVKAGQMRARRSPLAWANQGLRPVAALVQPLFRLALRRPGLAGQVGAEVALTLAAAPSAILLLVLAWAAAAAVAPPQLPAVLAAAALVWGVLISDIGTRDWQAGAEALSGVVAGGPPGRYLRQVLAAVALGLLFMGPVGLRWLAGQPLRAVVLLSGIGCLGALAQLSARGARTLRLFIALFLTGWYAALNVRALPVLDMVGLNGSATPHSLMRQSAVAVLALAAGLAYERWSAARA